MKLKDWNIEAMTGYKPITTFYMDFSIADHFGESAIRDTYKRCLESWKDDYKYLTELVMALNWKIWEHYQSNMLLAQLYNELYDAAFEFADGHLKGDELSYFYRTID